MEKDNEYVGILVLVLSVVGIWFFKGGDTWEGFYYPDGCLSCSENYIYSPEFKTKEECFDWADSLKISRKNLNDLFECGLNCKDKGGFNVCEETVD